MKPLTANPEETEKIGLGFWMATVMQKWEYSRHDFAPEQVHDLRVALRRCRSIADGFVCFDPHPAWKRMKNEGKKLFRQLGALRDAQVMMELARRLISSSDDSCSILNLYLADQEKQLTARAEEALQVFDRKKWGSWKRLLSERSQRVPLESLAFRQIALERWSEMRALHRQALRNRSHVAYHRLRIGLKKFRYTIENFLPSLYASWGQDLRELQDLLGEMHDLHVLWQTALSIKAFRSEETRIGWRQRISNEIKHRLNGYREKMLGKTSQAFIWRIELEDSSGTSAAALAKLRAWAVYRDPDVEHSELVTALALQIYDGLEACALIPADVVSDARLKLEAAALLHDAGLHKGRKKHHITSYRLIRNLDPPLGWSTEALQHIALIARFHRGSLPRSDQKAISNLPDELRKVIIMLCGILRLANAFDWKHEKRIHRIELERTETALHLMVEGYSRNDAAAEKLAAARHLLEVACELPIVIK
jgi:CHAD domain-containing protein/HD superfamily phosphodiesterase